MSKWIGGIITTLVVLAATSLLGALLKGPIDDFASRDRLLAEVQLAPYFARPAEVPEAASGKSEIEERLEKSLDEIEARSAVEFADVGRFEAARIIITNESKAPVTDINFRLSSSSSADVAVVLDQTGKRELLREPTRVAVPDLRPGDRATVYLWGGFSTILFPDAFDSYSSAGRFRVTYDWPRRQGRSFESGIGIFLDQYAGEAAWILGVLLFFFVVMAAVLFEAYAKSLLKEEAFYHVERARFEADPTKFAADLSKATKT